MVEVYPDNLRQLTYYNEWLPSRMSEREDILNTYCEGVTERSASRLIFSTHSLDILEIGGWNENLLACKVLA